MAQLIVVGFTGDSFRAGEALHKLCEMNRDWIVDLKDAVAVYRDHTGKLYVDDSYQMTRGEEAGVGAIWGAMIGALIAIPFTAGASVAATAGALAATALGGGVLGATSGAFDAAVWKEEFGVPEEFVKTTSGMIQPRDSAVFALLDTVDAEKVANEFRGYGGTVLQTTLTKEQADKVQAVLKGASVSRA